MRKAFQIALILFPWLVLNACAGAYLEPDWLGVQDFLYQLQRARPDRIGDTAFDLVVVSLSATGNSPDVIPALKDSPGGPKIVLCYMSIGQAENYRWYYQPEWGQNPPEWMGERDPVWGDRWVQYWHPEWQAIIYGSPESYLDKIIELGFDGVYLDRVDAYWYYQEQGRNTAAREMVDFVLDFTEYARRSKSPVSVSFLKTLKNWVLISPISWSHDRYGCGRPVLWLPSGTPGQPRRLDR